VWGKYGPTGFLAGKVRGLKLYSGFQKQRTQSDGKGEGEKKRRARWRWQRRKCEREVTWWREGPNRRRGVTKTSGE